MNRFEPGRLRGQRFDEQLKCFLELQGVEYRVVRVDQEYPMVTADYSPYRINIEIDAGVITDAYYR